MPKRTARGRYPFPEGTDPANLSGQMNDLTTHLNDDFVWTSTSTQSGLSLPDGTLSPYSDRTRRGGIASESNDGGGSYPKIGAAVANSPTVDQARPAGGLYMVAGSYAGTTNTYGHLTVPLNTWTGGVGYDIQTVLVTNGYAAGRLAFVSAKGYGSSPETGYPDGPRSFNAVFHKGNGGNWANVSVRLCYVAFLRPAVTAAF